MPLPPYPPRPAGADPKADEQRMRRALGLTGDRVGQGGPSQPEQPRPTPEGRPAGRTSAGKPRHRFVQDGAVPVTLVNRRRPDEADGSAAGRTAIEAALQDERAVRTKAERMLQEALATVRDLQTKLGHAELARQEEADAALAARAAVEALRVAHQERERRWQHALAAERAARAVAEAARMRATSARGHAERTRQAVSTARPAPEEPDIPAVPAAAVPAKTVMKRAPRVASTPRPREPRPVKWWLKSAEKR